MTKCPRKKTTDEIPSGFQDENGHEAPYTWQATFPGSSHGFQDGASDQEDSDQDSYDQDMDYMLGDSDSKEDAWDRGSVVAEMCRRWGWTLEDVLETLEQPSLSGGRKYSQDEGVFFFFE